MSSETKRKVILLIDMDCFYVQVERRKNPELCGKPCIVVQGTGFNPEGATIAVSYEARKFGVSRSIRETEAKNKCPDLQIAYVPVRRGKADLTCYRQASAEVIRVLSEFTDIIERASIDEAFLDVTELVHKRIRTCDLENLLTVESIPNTYIPELKGESSEGGGFVGWVRDNGRSSDLLLATGAMVANDIRKEVFERTGFTCSAGVGYNKMVAKLCAGMNKPNGQTILPPSVLPAVFLTTPIGKIRHLGGKLGAQCKRLFGVENIGELRSVSLSALERAFGAKTSTWLYGLCRGEDSEPVRVRTLPQSIGCGKEFPGRHRLTTVKEVKHWLQQLAEEVSERLAVDQKDNNRHATLMSVSFLPVERRSSHLTRCFPIESLDPTVVMERAWTAITKGQVKVDSNDSALSWTAGLAGLYLSASKFSDGSTTLNTPTIDSLFARTSNQHTPITMATSEHSVVNTGQRSTNSHSYQHQKSNTSIMKYFSPVKKQDQPDNIIDSNSPPAKKQRLEDVSDSATQENQLLTCVTANSPLTSITDESLPTPADSVCVSQFIDDSGNSTSKNSDLRPNEFNLSVESLSPELVRICGVCGCHVPVWAEQEHADYHLAQQLQQEDQGLRIESGKKDKKTGCSSILDFVMR